MRSKCPKYAFNEDIILNWCKMQFMKPLLLLLLTLSIAHAQELTLMSKSTIFGIFKMSLLTPVCYDQTLKRKGIDQTCFLIADGHKLYITKKRAKLYKKKRRGKYTLKCVYDQKAKVFHKCYITK